MLLDLDGKIPRATTSPREAYVFNADAFTLFKGIKELTK